MTRLASLLVLALTTFPCPAQVKNGFDLGNSAVDPALIEFGGPGRDGIPSIDNPKFLDASTAEKAEIVQDDDRIIGVVHRGAAKAYPTRILDWHEVVNDEFDGAKVLVTYCPLCNTGMVFDVADEKVAFTFGVSGLLYNSDVLLYDRQTGSLWSQIMSQAISGPMKGAGLPLLPSRHTTWRDWRHRHPDTVVLSPDTGHKRNYSVSPYLGYARSPTLLFDVEHESGAYQRKELVLGITIDGRHKAYALRELKEVGAARVEDEFADRKLTVVWSESENSAHAVDSSGNEIPSVLAYWFAWYAFHPDTEVFRAND